MRMSLWLVPPATMAITAQAAAHGTGPGHAHDGAATWSLDPVVIALLTITLVLYAVGVGRLWRRAGRGRSVSSVAVTAFASGWLAIVFAIVSPLDALSDALFSAHMVQHLVLMLVAAPLLAVSMPVRAGFWALPLRTRRRLARAWLALPLLRRAVHGLARPGIAFLLLSVSLWVWHLPLFYDAAVRNAFLHSLEHASFVGSSLLFWWTLLNPRRRLRLDYGTAVLLTFLASLQSALLGALLTFAQRPWYRAHLESAPMRGYTPLQDQELAGLIMWIPASAAYLTAIVAFAFAWLRDAERRAPRRRAPRPRTNAPPAGTPPAGVVVERSITAPPQGDFAQRNITAPPQGDFAQRNITAPLCLLAFIFAGTAACGMDTPQSALAPDGPAARAVFDLWWVLLALAVFVVVVVSALLIYASVRRRDFDGAPATLPLAPDVEKKIRDGVLDPAMQAAEQVGAGMVGASRDVALETSRQDERSLRWILGGGFVFPVIVLTPLFLFTLWTLSLLAARDTPPDLSIEVTGRQYWWEVHYLDAQGRRLFETANEIHIPVGRRVQVRLRSADVIHSFWVPRLAPKVDNVPGRTNVLWLEADRPGEYRGQCAEYCGTQHAHMAFLVVAEPEDRFAAWMAGQQRPAVDPVDPLAVAGRDVFLRTLCRTCHAIRGTAADGDLGPDLTHVASRLTLASGMLPNTAGHMGGWIADPQALKPGSLMPSVPLERGELESLLHYMGSLR